jgi:hypothetical protein
LNSFVVDTNVTVVANRRSPQAGPQCVLACVDALEGIKQYGKIVLDDQSRILDEYRKNLSFSGQPGFGDVFFKWVWQNQGNVERCERVEIHPRKSDEEDYLEFPSASSLHGFHSDDKKFVAVALGSRNNPDLLNAVDQDWWDYRAALKQCGVRVKFLCPGQFCSHGKQWRYGPHVGTVEPHR